MNQKQPPAIRRIHWIVSIVAVLGTVLGIAGIVHHCRGEAWREKCDLDRRLFETTGSQYEEIRDSGVNDVHLFRVHRARDLGHSEVVGCTVTGEFY